MNRILVSSLLASSLIAACNSQGVVIGGLQEVTALRSVQNRNLDILFVIDDSTSTADKQVSFANAFPKMIDVLSQLDGGLPNLHLGVVTTDLGTSSAHDASPGPAIGQIGLGGCSGFGKDGALQKTTDMTDAFLSDVEGPGGTRVRNYTGALRDTFGTLAQVGANGCGFEQPLAAMKRALVNPANVGFLRPDANLAVVFLADEDDCSASSTALFGPDSAALGPLDSFRCFRHGVRCSPDVTSVGPKHDCIPADDSTVVDDLDPYVDALLASKSDARMVMTAAIVGDPTQVAVELHVPPGGGAPMPALAHSCSFNSAAGTEVADPAVRLAGFLESFDGRATLTSVCSSDLSNPLHAIGASAKRLMGDPCLDSTQLADTSAEIEGVQPSCEVVDIRDSSPDAAKVLPLCSSGDPNCYAIVADAAACPSSDDHLRVRISRTAAVAEDSWTYVRCQLAN
ncbi:hypothetical protein BH11MYX3_BH11MYX3_19110 [soil metagenome]